MLTGVIARDIDNVGSGDFTINDGQVSAESHLTVGTTIRVILPHAV